MKDKGEKVKSSLSTPWSLIGGVEL